MNIYLKALGCRLNEAELEDWASDFQTAGHTIVPGHEHTDMVVINTCAVTNEAVKKSRQLIRRTHRHNPYAKLVVSGCYASLAPELQEEISAIDLLVPNRDKDRLPDIVNEQLIPGTMPAVATSPGEAALYQRGRNRAFIKIQDGCRYRCTFCIVTVARGQERSRPVGDIIAKINQLQQQDVKEVVLTGVHVGGYGSDIDTDLSTLIRAILNNTDIPRLRLASVEPWDLPDDFFELFANGRLMPHMHLPLQSGSDTVLKAMARRCKTTDYARLVDKARSHVPGFNLTTDIIVGFPGETDAEWQKGLEFIEKTGFSHIHIFPYSPRAGTRAAAMPDQVSPAAKKKRCRLLNVLAKEMKRDYLSEQIGTRAPVLIETQEGEIRSGISLAAGYTPNYHRVEVNASPDAKIRNEIKEVSVLSLNASEDGLRGQFT